MGVRDTGSGVWGSGFKVSEPGVKDHFLDLGQNGSKLKEEEEEGGRRRRRKRKKNKIKAQCLFSNGGIKCVQILSALIPNAAVRRPDFRRSSDGLSEPFSLKANRGSHCLHVRPLDPHMSRYHQGGAGMYCATTLALPLAATSTGTQ